MGKDFPGSRSLIVEALRSGSVPEEALQICLASICESTVKQYNSGLKMWWNYRKSKGLDIFSATIPEILAFFTMHFQNGASVASLNSFRAALAQILKPDLISDFRIKRFFRGIQNLRPAIPKYAHTWDPSLILNYIKSVFSGTLSIEQLTYKTVILIALATGQRVQTLSSIDVEDIIKHNETIEIKIPKRLKTTGKGRIQPTLLLPYFNADPVICPARTLIEYLQNTSGIRQNFKKLFITFKKPFREATAQTVSRWIKLILKKGGLDTTQFTAHSTRHASTSAAARKGISYDVIRLAAGWTEKSSTFARFYNRPIVTQSDFATAVLSS